MGDVESAGADNPPALGAGPVVLWVGHLFLVYLAQGCLPEAPILAIVPRGRTQ